jgi:histidinol-phosphate/aromatic aminotransferase/cobyric acid decarboxylase-like protein
MSLGPSRASFVWLSSSRHGAADIVAALSRRAVLVASGAAWGDERHVRLALRDEAATVRVLAALRDLG